MNKAVALGLCAVLVCSLTACGTGTGSAPTTSEVLTTAEIPSQTETAMDTTEDTNDETTGQNMETVGTESSSEDGGILIAYFSRVGNTNFADGVDASSSASIQLNGDEIAGNMELIAGMIQNQIGGDVFLIETEEKYPADYDEVLDVAQAEGGENARPELASHVEHMEDYKVVFLGYPNWWGDCPMAVCSFLEEYNFSDKTVIPFCTSGGSGLSGTVSTIREMLPEANVMDGFAAGDSGVANAQDAIAKWVEGLGITP